MSNSQIVARCLYSQIGCWSAAHRCYQGRYDQIFLIAQEVFGNPEKARRWLRRPAVGLGVQAPCSYLSTSTGYSYAHELLMRIHHGICF
ncbi:MbcA/ParS/Xre antitoxin family protein [Pseudomonas fluorescens]|uniref:MbcA/ParS/Xre antitoxin family protein n=1 Tax=Pseudomonas fluorescens TaxID=294 RepID=UPI001911AB52|nr:MbcA/ParS/Xre antitoxin family protein [Pseudomonas fluorescens]